VCNKLLSDRFNKILLFVGLMDIAMLIASKIISIAPLAERRGYTDYEKRLLKYHWQDAPGARSDELSTGSRIFPDRKTGIRVYGGHQGVTAVVKMYAMGYSLALAVGEMECQ
jgi:hypothetical protein